MALLTTAEVKTFLRITGSDYDTLIGVYIPLIEEDICEYLNTYFEDNVIFIERSGGLAFTRGNTATSSTQADYITDDNQDFSTAGFAVGQDVIIAGGSNWGMYTIKGLTSAVMTLDTTGTIITQDQDASFNTVGTIRISRQKWPSALKPIAAKMIWYQIEKAKPDGAISESIDDYSITFAGSREYPMQLINQLKKWRYVRAS